MEYKIILSGLAIIIGFIGYIPYYLDILKGKTKPHTFSWLGWGLLEGIIFFVQIKAGGGPGAYVTGMSGLLMIGIVLLSFRYGDKDIKPIDWMALFGGIIGIVLWKLTNNPLAAVILITIADACLFFPTYRKAYYKPKEETLIEYLLSSVRWILAIFALQTYSLTTWLYPASLIITNGVFTIMLVIRRRKV